MNGNLLAKLQNCASNVGTPEPIMAFLEPEDVAEILYDINALEIERDSLKAMADKLAAEVKRLKEVVTLYRLALRIIRGEIKRGPTYTDLQVIEDTINNALNPPEGT